MSHTVTVRVSKLYNYEKLRDVGMVTLATLHQLSLFPTVCAGFTGRWSHVMERSRR